MVDFTLAQEPEETSLAREQLFISGEAYFDALVADCAQARSTIDLEVYIFRKDAVGRRVAETLILAAQRGVRVRVLVDGAGTPFWGATFANSLEKFGIETKIFHPFPWELWSWRRCAVRWPLLLKWIYFLLKMNSRNHRKVCVIDQKIAYIGSANICQCHLSKDNKGSGWRDMTVRLCRLDFSAFLQAFEQNWFDRGISERLRDAFKVVRGDPIIRLNNTWYRRRILYKNLLRRIRGAQQRIWIMNAYFVPDNFLLHAIKQASKSGVDVRILLSKKSDILLMPWASSTFYYNLLKSGARIFEYLPSNLHAKSLIIDDWMLVGSSNFNHRSLLHDLEADVQIVTLTVKQQLVDTFLHDLAASREVTLPAWKQNRSWLQRFLGRVLLYIKFWI